MPKSEKNTPGNRIGIIGSVTSPLSFYVLALLIIETFLGTALVAGGIEPEDKFDVILAALGVFVYVVSAVTLLVWARPWNIMLRFIPLDSAKMAIHSKFNALSSSETISMQANTRQTNPAALHTFGESEEETAAALLRIFWKPDGKTIDKQHEAILKKWKKAKGLAELSITALINVEMFAELRSQAVRELGLASGENP